MALVPQVKIGGNGGRAGGGRCPPSRMLAARGRRGGGAAPPRSGPLAAACAGERCPAPSSAPLPTSARHSPARGGAGGRAAWRLRPLAGTAGTGGRLEGAGGAWGCALRVALGVMPGARVQDAHDFLASTWVGRLRVKTGLSTRPDGVGHTSLALCVEGDVMGVLCMAASCVRSTLPPLHPHEYSRGSLSAEICWFGSQHA